MQEVTDGPTGSCLVQYLHNIFLMHTVHRAMRGKMLYSLKFDDSFAVIYSPHYRTGYNTHPSHHHQNTMNWAEVSTISRLSIDDFNSLLERDILIRFRLPAIVGYKRTLPEALSSATSSRPWGPNWLQWYSVTYGQLKVGSPKDILENGTSCTTTSSTSRLLLSKDCRSIW